ncbi:MAG: NTP transferase domain-containing protein [Alphaproteobacteria bacterium]|nr:NTP transferase domain-containing protein [Alphaproteobacteria bacterium]
MNGHTAAFISVRNKATRLPNKSLLKIHGRSTIEHLIDRVKRSQKADLIVMTTSISPEDDPLAEIAAANGIACFRGSEADKLQRYLDAADAHDVDFFAVVDGDDLFADAIFIDQIIAAWQDTRADYIVVDRLPVGATAFGVRRKAMREIVALKAENDTEVWGGYFTETGMFDCRFLVPSDSEFARPEIRMTLDYPEDFKFFTLVFDELYVSGEVFSFQAIMILLRQRPEIAAVNRDVQHRYEARLRESAPVRLKPASARIGTGGQRGR